MSSIARRLQRLEKRFRPAADSQQTRHLRARLEAARLRYRLPPTSPERLVELRTMNIVAILNSGRQRARERIRNDGF